MRTNVYIDGFNFYYGCFKHSSGPDVKKLKRFRWVNLRRLCEDMLPDQQVNRIHYCTARVSSSSTDPNKSLRQEVYLRALGTLPQFSIHYGSHQRRQKVGMLLDASSRPIGRLATVEVWEEKGSDVNLASYLLMDAFLGDFERAVIVSNDSDLAEPIRIVKTRLGLEVEVMSPYPTVSSTLRKASSNCRVFDKRLLEQCQFPRTMYDRNGKLIHKPARWN